MPRFPAWLRNQLHLNDQRNIDKAIGPDLEEPQNKHIPTAGDLRGIPAIGRGVTGAIPGTKPGDSIR